MVMVPTEARLVPRWEISRRRRRHASPVARDPAPCARGTCPAEPHFVPALSL